MKDYTIRFIYDRINETGCRKKVKGKKYKDTGLIQIEVRKDNTDKRAWISTGVRVTPEQYTMSDGVIKIRNHDNAKSLSGKLRDRLREVDAFVSSEKCRDISDAKNWNKADFSSFSVVDFIQEELKRRNPSYSVVEYNNSFIKRLKEYGKIKTFSDLTYENIVGLDTHLRKTIESEPTLYKRHSLFKGYIQEAINRGLYDGMNPYSLFKNKKGKSKDPIFLSEEEIIMLENYKPNYGYLERTKDLYLFQCYTGLAYSDLMKFNKDSVSELDGEKIIRSNRVKTEENYIVWLSPKAIELAEKYEYKFPRITNQKYNEYLKEVAAEAEIHKPLTSHSARHTFATYLLNKDIPIESVSSALGHSNIKQTQHYAKLLGKKVISDMKSKLGGKELPSD